MTHRVFLPVLLALLAPAVALAEDARAAPPAAPTSPAPEKPVAVAVPAPAGDKLTVDVSGWLVLTSWADFGALSASDCPRYALVGRGEQALGASVRQSRLRAAVGIPGGGLLGGATLKAFVEGDFYGGYASSDESMPLGRLRHAWLSATWKDLGNLSVLVGQTDDLFRGPVIAKSLAHLATPRFSGAGFLHRRTPQVRVQGDLGGDLAFAYQVGVLADTDKTTQTASSTGVGYRSFTPDMEARLALLYRAPGLVKAEVGMGGHLGQERWLLAGTAGSPNHFVTSKAVAVDARLDVASVTVLGGAFAGQNLDLQSSLAPGVKTTGASGSYTAVESVRTRGAWAQLQVVPVAPLQLLVGAGVEAPVRSDLPATFALGSGTTPAIYRNAQLSAGAILSLNRWWKIGLEGTRYVTYRVDGTIARSDQVELSSLMAL